MINFDREYVISAQRIPNPVILIWSEHAGLTMHGMTDPVITRRKFLSLGGTIALSGGMAFYASVLEPYYRLQITQYKIHPPRWIPGLKLKIAALADFHAGEGPMTIEQIINIVKLTNSLNPDIIVLLGDYLTLDYTCPGNIPSSEIAQALSLLKAPLGVFSVLGNHDWWNDEQAFKSYARLPEMAFALRKEGIPVLSNEARYIRKDNHAFWLAGLESQWSPLDAVSSGDDLPKTLATITDDLPVIMLAHEPDIFPELPRDISLTLSGHTHGGQIRLFGYSPKVPSRFGNRYAYGHIIENGKHLIVSGGLGTSGANLHTINQKLGKRLGSIGNKVFHLRFGVPPEIVLIDVE